jgi:hypothetical protein
VEVLNRVEIPHEALDLVNTVSSSIVYTQTKSQTKSQKPQNHII